MPKPKDAKQQACAPSSLTFACYFTPVRQALCIFRKSESMEEIKIPDDIVAHVSGLLDSGEDGFDVMKLRYLESEEDQHDDDLIDSIVQKFTVVLKSLALKLDDKYGNHKFTSDLEEESEEEEDEFYVPGSYASAVWEKEEFILYLAVCQEDREFPIMLVVGVEY